MASLPAIPFRPRPLDEADTDRLRQVYPDLWADPAQTCLICDKKGTYLSPDGDTRECDCYEQWRLHWQMLHCGIKRAYQRLSFDDVRVQVPVEVRQAVQEYLDHAEGYVRAGVGMILSGKPGTGKTMLAVLLLKQMLGLGYDGYFTQFTELLDSYTATFRDAEETLWFTRRIRNADILVIDDIGREYAGRMGVIGADGQGFTSALFDDVIRHRTGHEKPTIVTTNYTEEQLQAGYGGGVLSLLSERCTFYEVTGPDFRPTFNERVVDEVRRGVVRPFTYGG